MTRPRRRSRPDLLVALVAIGCSSKPAPQPQELGAYLRGVDAGEVAGWRLDEAAWRRIVVEPYRDLYADYAREFDRLAPSLAASVAQAGAVREHFAGDPELTQDQAVARWALPPLYPSRVAASIDAVFLRDGERWRTIVGLGAILHARVAAIDAACAALFAVAHPHLELTKTCRDATWPIADAVLRSDRERASRACKLAANVCGKRSPP